MTGVIHVVGENGAALGFTEPLPPVIAKRIASGALRLVDDPEPGSVLGEQLDLFAEPEPVPVHVEDAPVVEQVSVDPLSVPVPRGNASHADWIDYAVTQGMPHAEAVALKRDELRTRFVLDDGQDGE